MKKLIFITLSLIIFLFAFAGKDGTKVAIVKLKKGNAVVIKVDGSQVEASKGLWVEQGSVIKTESKSFVKLSFVDKSTMNVGPNSEMKIEKFSKDEPGVINVISGKIRSKVSKDYLQMEKDKSKLFVKSKSAVMGIRGTDFAFTTNKKTGASTAVLFEGSVVFNRINKKNMKDGLENIVNQGHRIKPGQFSVARMDLKKPTMPAKMSTKQIRALEKNETFADSSSRAEKKSNTKSVVPPGLSGSVVANTNESLETGINKIVKIDIAPQEKQKMPDESSKGFVKGDLVKPVDGSIVHIESGTIIPIGNDAVFDSNAGEWVSNSVGSVDSSGSYVPPESFTITNEGQLLKEVDNKVQVVNTEVKPMDDVPALQQVESQVIATDNNITPINGDSKGKQPAGTLDEDVPPTGTDSNTESNLSAPPIPQGTTYMPPTYYQFDPNSATAPGAVGTRTPIRVKVNRGN